MTINELNESIARYKQAASDGDADAQYNLGICYEESNDFEHAAKWLKKAAKQRGEIRSYNLGSCYMKGLGVEQSYTEAIKWFRKSISLNHK